MWLRCHRDGSCGYSQTNCGQNLLLIFTHIHINWYKINHKKTVILLTVKQHINFTQMPCLGKSSSYRPLSSCTQCSKHKCAQITGSRCLHNFNLSSPDENLVETHLPDFKVNTSDKHCAPDVSWNQIYMALTKQKACSMCVHVYEHLWLSV